MSQKKMLRKQEDQELEKLRAQQKAEMLEGQVCRICLGEENTQEDPLLSPCKCAGTMRMIHLACLREWLNSKKTQKDTEGVVTYCWKAIECELCQVRFPSTIYSDGTNAEKNDLTNREIKRKGAPIDILQYDTPLENFVVLESVTL